VIFICFILFLTGILRGEEPLSILLISISLAVAAIPEALPALITISLSKGATILAKTMLSLESFLLWKPLALLLLSVQIRQGTLTQNKMVVLEAHDQNIYPP